MIRHPAPSVIAKQLRHLADTLDDEGAKAIQRAAVLAARGYPSSTSGSGVNGSRSTTSSTERAAGLPGNERGLTPPLFAGIDERLAKLLRAAFQSAARADRLIGEINSHADTRDPIPAGTGNCDACGLFCRPTKDKPDFRLRDLFCPRHYHAWRRWRMTNPDCTKDQFIYTIWRQNHPEGTTDQYLAWRKAKLDERLEVA